MTPRQQIALAFTCRLPEETGHARFYRYEAPIVTALTLNSGFE